MYTSFDILAIKQCFVFKIISILHSAKEINVVLARQIVRKFVHKCVMHYILSYFIDCISSCIIESRDISFINEQLITLATKYQ